MDKTVFQPPKIVFEISTTMCENSKLMPNVRVPYRKWTVLAFNMESAIKMCAFDKKNNELVEEARKICVVNVW